MFWNCSKVCVNSSLISFYLKVWMLPFLMVRHSYGPWPKLFVNVQNTCTENYQLTFIKKKNKHLMILCVILCKFLKDEGILYCWQFAPNVRWAQHRFEFSAQKLNKRFFELLGRPFLKESFVYYSLGLKFENVTKNHILQILEFSDLQVLGWWNKTLLEKKSKIFCKYMQKTLKKQQRASRFSKFLVHPYPLKKSDSEIRP